MHTTFSTLERQDIFLTGASSEIGLHVLDLLRKRPDVDRIFIMARKPPQRHAHGLHFLRGDLVKVDSLQSVTNDLRDAGFRGIAIHMAANTNFLQDEECYAANHEGTLHLMNGLRNVPGLRRLLYVGTAMNCGIRPNQTVRISDPLPLLREAHLTAYTHSKALAEDEITRTAWPYEIRIAKPTIMMGCTGDIAPRRDNILWVVKAIFKIGFLPMSGTAGLDCTTYDFGASALVALAFKANFRHQKLFITPGVPFERSYSQFTRELADELARVGIIVNLRFLDLPQITPNWADCEKALTTTQRRLASALVHHFRFLAMNVRFEIAPLLEELELFDTDVPSYFDAIPTIARYWDNLRVSTRSISLCV